MFLKMLQIPAWLPHQTARMVNLSEKRPPIIPVIITECTFALCLKEAPISVNAVELPLPTINSHSGPAFGLENVVFRIPTIGKYYHPSVSAVLDCVPVFSASVKTRRQPTNQLQHTISERHWITCWGCASKMCADYEQFWTYGRCYQALTMMH